MFGTFLFKVCSWSNIPGSFCYFLKSLSSQRHILAEYKSAFILHLLPCPSNYLRALYPYLSETAFYIEVLGAVLSIILLQSLYELHIMTTYHCFLFPNFFFLEIMLILSNEDNCRMWTLSKAETHAFYLNFRWREVYLQRTDQKLCLRTCPWKDSFLL